MEKVKHVPNHGPVVVPLGTVEVIVPVISVMGNPLPLF